MLKQYPGYLAHTIFGMFYGVVGNHIWQEGPIGDVHYFPPKKVISLSYINYRYRETRLPGIRRFQNAWVERGNCPHKAVAEL